MSIVGKVLELPAIPELLAAMGYPMEKYPEVRKVAIFWGAGDEAYWDNGRYSADGEWEAYLRFFDFYPITMTFREERYLLGSSDGMETHYLVLDLTDQTGILLPTEEARKVLREQWGDIRNVDPLLELPENIELTDEMITEINQKVIEAFQAIPHSAFAAFDRTEFDRQRKELADKMVALQIALNHWGKDHTWITVR
jgi:hypothetical protein